MACKLIVVAVIAMFATFGDAIKMNQCSFIRELKNLGAPAKELSTWSCIAYHESRYDTAAVGRLNSDKSTDNGIFQINDRYWCKNGSPGKGCNLSCESLRDSNIKNDYACVKTIFKEHQRLEGNGFLAWTTYKQYCSGGRDVAYGC